MQLVFLDRSNLAYKDYGYVDTNFEIALDLVIIQKSIFTVNKTKLNVTVGDIVILKDAPIKYIGIVERLEVADKHRTSVHVVDFKEMFSIDIPVQSYSGDLGLYLENVLISHFKQSDDTLQNLNYLSIKRDSNIQGELSFETDKIMSLASLMELITKSYGLRLKTEAVYIRGRVTGIVFHIGEVQRGIKLRSNFQAIQDLVVNDSSSQMVNKLVYYPKSENVIHKTKVEYFMLKNGELTHDKNHPNRYKTVKPKVSYYTDNDYPALQTKARSEMIISKLDHNITFTIKTDNDVLQPLMNIELGDFIEFINNEQSYDSVVTGIKFNHGFHQATMTLGEYRIKLTEKIQLLNKSVSSVSSHVSIQTTGITDLDGGEF